MSSTPRRTPPKTTPPLAPPATAAGERARLLAGLDASERALFAALSADGEVLRGLDREGWRGLCEASLRTFSAPLLHAALGRSHLLSQAPEEVVVRLARVRAWSAARWGVAQAQLTGITARLAAEGIACIALKGAHTGHLYDTPGARAHGDLDLLLRPEQVRAAEQSLHRAGYRSRPVRSREAHRHLPPLQVRGGLPVELHWTLASGATPPQWTEALWRRAAPLPDGVTLAMSPADALLHTCKHLATDHLFSTANAIAGLSDVGVLLAAPGMDWGALAPRAREWGVQRDLALCLHLAEQLLGVRVPHQARAGLGAEGISEIAPVAVASMMVSGRLGAIRHLLRPTRATLNPPPPVSALGGLRPAAAMWSYLRSMAWPMPDDLRLDYPGLGRWGIAAYPLHWSRMAWRHAGLVQLARPEVREEAWGRMHRREERIRTWLQAG